MVKRRRSLLASNPPKNSQPETHRSDGSVSGAAGSAPHSSDDQDPKYLFPSAERHGFHKSHLLFNLHGVLRTARRVRTVAVVEGFFDCFRMTEAGFPAVAVMESSVSEEQAKLLRTYFRFVALVGVGLPGVLIGL